MTKLTDSILAMASFGKSPKQEEDTQPKQLLTQAIKTVLGESQGMGTVLAQSLTLIPSNQVEELIAILESVIQEYRRLRDGDTESKEPSIEA